MQLRVTTYRGRVLVKWLMAGVYAVLLALSCNLLVELLQTGGNVSRLVSYTLGSAGAVTLLGTGVVLVVVVLVWSLTGRLSVTTVVMLTATVLIGYANYLKITLRREPLYPSDLDFMGSPGFLFQMVSGSTVLAVVALLLAVVTVVVVISRVLNRSLPRIRRATAPRIWWTGVAARVVAVALALSFLHYAASFNSTDNRIRAAYEASGARWAFWFQRLNYYKNGFVGGVLYNLDVPAMVRPTDYSRSAIDDIARRYSAATPTGTTTSTQPTRRPNIVVVLSEAFSDPTRVQGVRFAEDPIPRTRALMKRTTSGMMLAQLFGGGTANMEFEALTGMSLSQFEPQMNTPYQMLVPKYRQFPSVVGYLKSQGYDAKAIHPYMTTMYKREVVYPVLGFDRFIGEKDMPGARKLERSDFISDASAFAEVEKQLDLSDKPALINLVTMQNHVPMNDFYDDPIGVTGLSKDSTDAASNYARGARYTDDALAKFLADLERSDEDTVVVFYGDHLPAVYPESIYDKNGDLRMRQTPFFYWANFDLPKTPTAPLTSPIYFVPDVLSKIGAPLPPYYRLLLDLQKEVPAMEQGEYFTPDGRKRRLEDLSPRARQLLADYRMVQYDLSVGHRYGAERLFYPLAGEGTVSASQ